MTAARKLWSVGDDDGEGGGNAYLRQAIVENDEVNVTPRMYVELEVRADNTITKRSLTIAQTELLIRALKASVALIKEGKGFVE